MELKTGTPQGFSENEKKPYVDIRSQLLGCALAVPALGVEETAVLTELLLAVAPQVLNSSAIRANLEIGRFQVSTRGTGRCGEGT